MRLYEAGIPEDAYQVAQGRCKESADDCVHLQHVVVQGELEEAEDGEGGPIEQEVNSQVQPRLLLFSQRALVLQELLQARRLRLEHHQDFFAELWIFDLLGKVDGEEALVVADVSGRPVEEEAADGARALDTLDHLDRQMHGCAAFQILLPKVLHVDPRQNVDHRELAL